MAIKSLKNGKAYGPDNIPHEILQRRRRISAQSSAAGFLVTGISSLHPICLPTLPPGDSKCSRTTVTGCTELKHYCNTKQPAKKLIQHKLLILL